MAKKVNKIDFTPLVMRGDDFDMSLADFTFTESKKLIAMKETFNKKIRTLADIKENYRVINYWTTKGLLEGTQKESGSWRKFSITDLCWLLVIGELRKVNFSIQKIKRLQSILFDVYGGKSGDHKTDYFNFFITLVLQGNDVYVVVLPDGTGDFLYGSELNRIDALVESDRSKSYVVINFNKLVAEVWGNPELAKASLRSVYLSDKEMSVLAEIRLRDDSDIEIKAKDGVVKKMNIKTKKVNPENAIKELREMIKEGGKKEITFKMEDGKIVCLEQTNKT